MGRIRSAWLAAVVAAWAMLPVRGTAGPFLDACFHKSDCPPTHYSCLHYWAPSLYTYYAYHHDLRGYYDKPDRYPQVPNDYRIIKFPCPGVEPANAPSNLYTR
jgi:hypothetical protein